MSLLCDNCAPDPGCSHCEAGCSSTTVFSPSPSSIRRVRRLSSNGMLKVQVRFALWVSCALASPLLQDYGSVQLEAQTKVMPTETDRTELLGEHFQRDMILHLGQSPQQMESFQKSVTNSGTLLLGLCLNKVTVEL